MHSPSRALLAVLLAALAGCARSHEPAADYSGVWLGEDGATLLAIAPDGRVDIELVFEEGACALVGRGRVEGDAIVAPDGARYPLERDGEALLVDDPTDGLLTGRYARVDYDAVCFLEPPEPGENGARAVPLPFGPLELEGARGTRAVELEVPEGTLSFSIYVFGGAVGQTVGPIALIAPGGEELFGEEPDLAFCVHGFCSVLVPKNGAIAAAPGTYRLVMEGPAEDMADLDARGIRRPGPRLPATAIAIRPIVASENLTSAEIEAILARLAAVYDERSTLALEVLDVVVADPSLARIPADFAHPDVVALTAQGDADALNVILVDRVTGISGLLGLAAGVPASLGIKGPWNGVLVSIDGHRFVGPALDTELVGDTVVHEAGHALGLYHTTEERGLLHDPVADTPECLPEQDANDDGSLTVDECEALDGYNFMFWTPVYADSFLAVQHEITEEQGLVLDHSVIGEAP